MGLQRTVAPTLLPVTLARLKLHLRITHSEEDDLLTDYLKAAVGIVESLTWRALLTQTLRVTLDEFPGTMGTIWLPRPRVQSITSIMYLDDNGDEQEWIDYRLDTSSEPARLVPDEEFIWPATLGCPGAVTITYVAGWEAASNVPSELVAAVLIAAATLYEHREDVDASKNTTVVDLCRLHSVHDPRVCMAFD